MKKGSLVCLFILFSFHLMGQEPKKEEFKRHEIAIAFGLTHIPEAFEEDN